MADVVDVAGTEDALVRVGKRIYVGNLAWKTSWQDLKDKFRECGNVVYANVMRDENDGRSKGWGIVEYETPQEAVAAISTLNGAELGGRRILVREDREDRDVKGAMGGAVGPDGTVPLVVGVPRSSAPKRRVAGRGGGRGGDAAPGTASGGRGGRGGRGAERLENSSGLQIVVQGIPWAYTQVELKDMFSALPDIQNAEIATGYDGRSRGFGTVRFGSQASAQHAIATFNGSSLDGRVLSVFLDKYA